MAYDASRAFINAFPVTPSDTEIQTAFGFYATTGTKITVMPSGQEGLANPVPVTFNRLTDEAIYIRDFVISRFMATDTDATDIVAFGPK